MPELPEVEVTRRQIAPLLVGRTISAVRTTPDSYLFVTRTAELRRRLRGRIVTAVDRFGKYLVAGLDDGSRLVVHLGMTGQLFAAGTASARLLSAAARAVLAPDASPVFRPDIHTHLRLGFADGGPEVLLRDVRKFGKVLWLAPGRNHPRLERLGVDALCLRGRDLHAASRGRRAAVKTLLLDQSVVAGVGNIYADEALFLAGVRPGRAAGRLSRREADAIAAALQRVLQRSIETGGSSIDDFVGPNGADGRFQDEHYVYGRAGAPCRACATPIRRRPVGQRTTHYCPRCQR